MRAESYYTAGQFALIRARFFRKPVSCAAGILLTILILTGLFASFLSPHEPNSTGANRQYINGPPQMPKFRDQDGSWSKPYLCTFEQQLDRKTLRRVQVENCEKKRYLTWFTRSWEYQLFSLDLGFTQFTLTSDLHLFGIETGQIHLFGTEKAGKDIFGRTLHAIWVSLSIGFLALTIKLTTSLLIGGISGYFGGRIDAVLQTFTEAVRVIPSIPIYLALAVAMPDEWSSETRYFAIAFIIGAFDFPTLARRLRTHLLAERNQEYILAAKLSGSSSSRIIRRHLIPSFLSYIIVDTIINVPYIILAETSLSFLGLGLSEPVNSIGVLLSQAQDVEVQQSLLWYYIPVVFFVLMILAFVLVGDGLRDAADPYSEDGR
jgi:peptide/nickel transport system permease protein